MKSGKKFDNLVKTIQKEEKINTSISYNQNSDGNIRAIITSGSCEYISRYFDNKEDARNESFNLLNESEQVKSYGK
jgi:hypothetical protein